MSSFLLIVLTAVVIYLLIRQWLTGRYLRELLDALRNKRPYLLSKNKSTLLYNSGLADLTLELNNFLQEHKRFLAEDADTLHRIEITLSSLSESVLIVDAQHRISMANTAARKLLNLPQGCEGKQMEQFLSSARFLEYMDLLREGKAPPLREIEIGRTAGQSLFLEISGTRILPTNNTGLPLTLIVLHDITRLKQLENIRREFVANVSHELRTPVTIIKGYSDTLIDDHERLTPEEQLRFLGKIQKNVHRLHLLLEDLLTLSRLERGHVGINLQRTSLSRLIGEQVENLTPRLGAGQCVTCDLAPELDSVNIDAIKISQVIRNILDNALRYAKGFTQIRISGSVQDNMILFAVQDDGCGVPEKDLPHIFERFYTVDKGRSRELGGTGLGLSIVKHIIQLHKGQVCASNIKPHGLRIEWQIPLQQSTVSTDKDD